MKAASEGHQLACVGPGTLMGEFMRQYWIPALMSRAMRRRFGCCCSANS